MRLSDQSRGCDSSITVPGPDGASVTLRCTKYAGHVKHYDNSDHSNAADAEPEEWQHWNNRGELTTDQHGWAEPSPMRTYTVRMSEDDFAALKDHLESGLSARTDRAMEMLERVVAALAQAEVDDHGQP